MLSAFDYDVPGVSHGHQTAVFDQNRLLRMETIFEDFVATADHKRAVGTVLESCSCCREMNTVNDAFNSGTTAKGFTINCYMRQTLNLCFTLKFVNEFYDPEIAHFHFFKLIYLLPFANQLPRRKSSRLLSITGLSVGGGGRGFTLRYTLAKRELKRLDITLR